MAIPDFELVVRGGTVVVPGRHEIADGGVRDGRIAQIGGAMTGQQELGAGGLLVIPGGVDAHTHLNCAALVEAVAGAWGPMWVDDFWTGSLAAIAGGITTIGNMTFSLPGESMTAANAREMAGASAEAAADWFLHPVRPASMTVLPPRSPPWRRTGTPASRCTCPVRSTGCLTCPARSRRPGGPEH